MAVILKPFQEKAIIGLRKQFLRLWKTNSSKLNLVFKAPTGSGKTIMIAQFIKDLAGDPQFDTDKAFVWITFSEDSYEQSKGKLFNYYNGAGEINLLDLNDLNKKKMEKNNVFFINWQKVKSSSKEGRKLRKESEKTEFDTGIFDEFIIRTQNENREIVLIIDEAHTQVGTDLADEVVDLINPKIIIKITATPKEEPSYSDVEHSRAGFVEIERSEVVEAGLIKEKILTQTKEDLDKVAKKEIDQDNLLLELAYNKRKEIIEYYKKVGVDYINPLVLIQLPNDDVATKETFDKTKEQVVKDFLKTKKIKDNNIAIWLSEKKENLEEVERNDSEVSFLIFKQAAATGWDCPRAQILVMFREIKNPTFHTQTVGRILRMSEAKHYSIPELNSSYLYTNYSRNQIELPDSKQGSNKPYIYLSTKSKKIDSIMLNSAFLSRTDFNDLGSKFQFTFEETADVFFNINKNNSKSENLKLLRAKGLQSGETHIQNQLIVDAEIENYDSFVEEIKKKGKDLKQDISRNDLERTYNLLCFNAIARQEEENKKFAPERSWGRLKTALNVWFQNRITDDRETYYKMIVNNLLKEDSIIKKIIAKSLENHKLVRRKEVKEKEERKERSISLEIPRSELFYTTDYEELSTVTKNAMKPFYIMKSYSGRQNEEDFIKYLESKKNVDWWYKNGSNGSENFAIKYFDETADREELFYPDWIIRLNSEKIVILDSKKGITASSVETKNKAEALQKWLKGVKKYKIMGGIAVKAGQIWKINSNNDYSYDNSFKNWNDLDKLID